MAEEETDQEIRRAIEVVQSMIDISADRLEGLRTQCATSAELTQQEIRTLEGKLIKLYCKQLVAKSKLKDATFPEMKHIPSLKQWLQVVGLSEDSIKILCQKYASLEVLQEKSEHDIRNILNKQAALDEEVRRLARALHNLKRYTEILLHGELSNESNELTLYWDSWDHHQAKNVGENTSPRPPRTRAACSSVASDECLPCNNNYNNGNGYDGSISTLATASSTSSISSLSHFTPVHYPVSNADHIPLSPVYLPFSQYTPPSTPPVGKSKGGEKGKFPTTPPPCKRHQTSLNPVLLPDTYPLTKSKSHESQLGTRIDGSDSNLSSNEQLSSSSTSRSGRSRLPTEPGQNSSDCEHTSPQLSSPVRSPPYNSASTDSDDGSYKATLQVPKSPRTPVTRGMGHFIAHRFTKTFKVMTTCDFCEKQMFIGTGLKCKECKYRCHRECEAKVPPSCGLPRELMEEFRRKLHSDGFIPSQSPNGRPSISSPGIFFSSLTRRRGHSRPGINIPSFTGPDSSSNTSSCNSSTPSSPALVTNLTPLSLMKQQQFQFPDVNLHESKGVSLEIHPLTVQPALEEIIESHKSNDSDLTISVSGSGSTDSERTPVRVDSQDSQVSDGEVIDRSWPRQNSLSMREWDIPYDELRIGEPIGTGRFGTVYRGNWHGDVAIKVLNMDHLDDEKTLESFRLEVATFRKTRHENLILFMGACMKPPRLAVVTSLCKGMTLFTHIHLRKDKFNMNKTVIIAQQISQGMGYLHARGIIHKDLKTKNIFLESGKVIITDFGLSSVTRLCHGNRKVNGLNISPGWLCYLAPEIIRSLKPRQKYDDDEELLFNEASDVYAFGTVWYELICGEWPFKDFLPEAIIWQVGRGIKQSLANLQASRDVKNILMHCWSFRAADRPDFTCLFKMLFKLPKKRLARSPSHPVHLSRSAESVL